MAAFNLDLPPFAAGAKPMGFPQGEVEFFPWVSAGLTCVNLGFVWRNSRRICCWWGWIEEKPAY
jgi:hypothetical protein